MLLRPLKTKKLNDKIYAAKTGVSNFYIYDGGDCLIAFDTGTGAAPACRELRSLGIDPDDVKYVFLTHSDYDHAGGLNLFKNAAVYISEQEVPLISGQKARLLGFIRNTAAEGCIMMKDAQTVQAGDCTVKIIHTPGHTPGSSCFLAGDGALFCGDALRLTSKGRIVPFLFPLNMNHEESRKSLNMLEDTGVLSRAEIILTAHTGILEKQSGS